MAVPRSWRLPGQRRPPPDIIGGKEAIVTDQGLLTLFLFLHIGAAIIAFGPTFAFPLIGALARTEPAHTNFAVRINHLLTVRLVIPFALTMPVTGLFLIYFAHVNLADRSGWWLDIAIVVYIVLI